MLGSKRVCSLALPSRRVAHGHTAIAGDLDSTGICPPSDALSSLSPHAAGAYLLKPASAHADCKAPHSRARCPLSCRLTGCSALPYPWLLGPHASRPRGHVAPTPRRPLSALPQPRLPIPNNTSRKGLPPPARLGAAAHCPEQALFNTPNPSHRCLGQAVAQRDGCNGGRWSHGALQSPPAQGPACGASGGFPSNPPRPARLPLHQRILRRRARAPHAPAARAIHRATPYPTPARSAVGHRAPVGDRRRQGQAGRGEQPARPQPATEPRARAGAGARARLHLTRFMHMYARRPGQTGLPAVSPGARRCWLPTAAAPQTWCRHPTPSTGGAW